MELAFSRGDCYTTERLGEGIIDSELMAGATRGKTEELEHPLTGTFLLKAKG